MAATSATRPLPALLATATLGAVGLGVLWLPTPAGAQDTRPDSFTSTFDLVARGGEVVGDVSGDSTATAAVTLQLNSAMDVLCYTITTRGIEPPYMSPARTSTHLHEAPAGSSGPPRLVFADPTSSSGGDPRSSSDCVTGPFTTGVTADGSDTGSGVTVADIEASPGDYYFDIHSATFPGGAVRAQLPASSGTTSQAAPAPAAPAPAAPAPAAPAPAAPAPAAPAPAAQAPVGGVAAGFGGLTDGPTSLPATAAVAAGLVVLAAGATGAAALGRRVPAPVRARRRG